MKYRIAYCYTTDTSASFMPSEHTRFRRRRYRCLQSPRYRNTTALKNRPHSATRVRLEVLRDVDATDSAQ